MKVTRKGQVTIPQDIRQRFGLLPRTEVEFRVDGDRVDRAKLEGQRQEGAVACWSDTCGAPQRRA